jgi:hypothetical protein
MIIEFKSADNLKIYLNSFIFVTIILGIAVIIESIFFIYTFEKPDKYLYDSIIMEIVYLLFFFIEIIIIVIKRTNIEKELVNKGLEVLFKYNEEEIMAAKKYANLALSKFAVYSILPIIMFTLVVGIIGVIIDQKIIELSGLIMIITILLGLVITVQIDDGINNYQLLRSIMEYEELNKEVLEEPLLKLSILGLELVVKKEIPPNMRLQSTAQLVAKKHAASLASLASRRRKVV